MELYQAEWCPHSHRVRQRLTELGLDVVARQVPADPEGRDSMRAAVGDDSIPVLVDGEHVLHGDEDILAHLDSTYSERPDAGRHRAKARLEVPEFEEVASRWRGRAQLPRPSGERSGEWRRRKSHTPTQGGG